MSVQTNQSYNIATIAHNAGFSIYNLNSIIHLKTRNIGSIKLCTILARSNIIALVGDGRGRNSFGASNISVNDKKINLRDLLYHAKPENEK